MNRTRKGMGRISIKELISAFAMLEYICVDNVLKKRCYVVAKLSKLFKVKKNKNNIDNSRHYMLS